MAEPVDPKDPTTWPSAKFRAVEWPRLSEDLAGVRALDRCQCCSIVVVDPPQGTTRNRRTVWQECDGLDRPEPGRYVVLCRPCAGPKGRGRVCGWEEWYSEPPRGCSGKGGGL